MRYGKVRYMKEFVETEWFGDVLAKASIVPIKVTVENEFGIYTMTGFSRNFDPLQPGDVIPEYCLKLKQENRDEFPEFDGITKLTEGGAMPWEMPGA